MPANLRIGAEVDIAELNSGMTQSVEEVRAAAAKIPIIFDEAAGRTKTAFKGISDEVRKAADTITAEQFRMAQATRGYNQALVEQRNAVIVARDAKLDDAARTALLASAQQRVAMAAAEVTAAKQAEARAVAEAAEEEALSENVVVRAFQRAALLITESTEQIREQLVETAEAGGLEAEGLSAGFAGFSKLLGAGIAIGFAANYIDGLNKVILELDHLSARTGISIQYLSGLQEIVKEAGAEFDPFASGLMKMEKFLAQVDEDSQKAAPALAKIGLSIQELRGLKPEEAFERIAKAIAQTTNQNERAAAAIAIFGKGGAALIPILREQGDQLDANVKKAAALTGVNEEAAEQARRWTAETQRLSAEFRSVMIPVLETVEDDIRVFVGVFESAAAAIVSVFEVAGAAIVSLVKPMGAVSHLIFDAMRGDFLGVAQDAKQAGETFSGVWKDAFAEIKRNWDVVKHDVGDQIAIPKLAEAEGGEAAPTAGKDKLSALERDEQQLNEMRIAAAAKGRDLMVGEEISFWQTKLDAAQKGSKEYAAIIEKLAALQERAVKQQKEADAKDAAQRGAQLQAIKEAGDEAIASIEAQEKAEQQAVKTLTQLYREQADEQMRSAEEGLRDTQRNLEEEVRLHKISKAQEIAQLEDATRQMYQIELQAIRYKEMLDQEDLVKHQQDLNRELELTRQFNQQMKLLALQTSMEWQQAWQKITTEINRAVAQWITLHKSFAQSMAQIMNGITQNFIQNVLKMTEQYLMGLLLQKAGQKQQILGDAKTAAANTYQAVSAIPYVGPFLAPPAAAAAFAAVLAFDSFDEGGVVRGAGGAAVPILAHAGERVLTPSQTSNFERLVGGSNAAASGGSSVHLEYKPNVSAYDRSGMKSTLRAHADDVLDIVRLGLKQGKLA